MSKFTNIAIAASMAVAVLGTTMASSQAAGMASIAPISNLEVTAETNIVKAGYRHHRRYWGGGYKYKRYGYRRHHCHWKKRKVWSHYYGYYIWKKIRVCH